MKYLTHELGFAIGRGINTAILHFLTGVFIIKKLITK